MSININKTWAMPNKETFSIKPIKELVQRYVKPNSLWVDPFAGNSKIAQITNDLDVDTTALYHKEALDFLKSLKDNEFNGCLFDPPYSPRQLSEVYKKNKLSVTMETTQSSYWSNCKKEIARIVKENGYVISCGWNSGGIGKKFGFDQIEILLVAHGGWHNDTIVTVERSYRL